MPKRSALVRREMRLAAVGEVYTFQVLDGRFGACQVMKRDEESRRVEVSTLDCLAGARPNAADLPHLKVFRNTWGSWSGKPSRCNVEERVPWWLELVASVEPVETFSEPCQTFGGW